MGVSSFMPRLLTVGCWNIGGLYEKINGVRSAKFEDETFRNTLKSFDILCLQESHIGAEVSVKVKNFHTITHCRQKSANNRYFGGMLLFIRESIRKGIKILKNDDKDLFQIDFVRDKDDKYSPINNLCYIKDDIIPRKNMDKNPIDQQGKKILELCKYYSLSNTQR